MSIADHMVTVFCFADDLFQSQPHLATWRTSNNARPAFCDAEVITVGLMQSICGVATLKMAYLLVKHQYGSAFPCLPAYANFIARLHRLAAFVGMLLMKVALSAVGSGNVFVLDSKPIPVCKSGRHCRVRLLREEGAYWGRSSLGWYFGFKLHTLAHSDGTIVGAFLTAGNVEDKDVVLALCENLTDNTIVLADRVYRDGRKDGLEQTLLLERGIVLLTPAHAKRAGTDDAERRALISSVRQRIETVFSDLWRRFVDRVFARSFDGLWSTIKLKMLHYNLCKAGILKPLN